MAFPSPTLTPPTLDNWQFSYNGLVMGAGTSFGHTSIEGLDLPVIGSGDAALPRDQGEFIGLDVMRGRDITFDFFLKSNGTSLQEAELQLAAATPAGLNSEIPLWCQLPGMNVLAIMCRPRKRSLKMDALYAAGARALTSLKLHATDPRVYSAPSQQATTSLPNPSGGANLPASFPLAFGSSSGPTGTLTVTNGGNFEMRPVLVLTGPVTNPSIENSTITGAPALTISNPTQTGYTVLAGDQLTIDLGPAHSVVYYSGGLAAGLPGATRMNWVVPGSQWWNLPPGSSLIHFSSQDSAPTGATLTVQWASAYML